MLSNLEKLNKAKEIFDKYANGWLGDFYAEHDQIYLSRTPEFNDVPDEDREILENDFSIFYDDDSGCFSMFV